MTNLVTLETTGCTDWVSETQLAELEPALRRAHQSLLDKTCPGSEFLGWLDLPVARSSESLTYLEQAAAHIRQNCDALVVVGIGGSHLAGQAGIEFIRSPHFNLLPGYGHPEIYFVGHNLSANDWVQILERLQLQHKKFAINVISKSGTTLEPAVAFEVYQTVLRHEYGDAVADGLIYATTDPHEGTLRRQAMAHGWTSFEIPPDVGGRYSGLSAVGLLPWAVAGLDVRQVLAGARSARDRLLTDQSLTNDAWRYAAHRLALLRQGKAIELLAAYEPALWQLGRWWQQLFAESEGKAGRGLFPVVVDYTQDLHSLGQYVQQGPRHLLETTLFVTQPDRDWSAHPSDDPDRPQLRGRKVSDVQKIAYQATKTAHEAGGVPQLAIHLNSLSEWHLGYLMYFFELSCALSALLLEVNPFDQPGVQAYKAEMQRLLDRE